MPEEKLKGYLTSIGEEIKPNQTPGMDCSVVETRHPGLFVVSTMDFFYPLVEDPYLQGRIACCNVLSDLFAMGVVEVDTVLMILGVCTGMSSTERDVTTRRIIEGFSAATREAGAMVTGGQTVLNPFVISGGEAKSVCTESEFIRPEGAQAGDVLVLTKPLGTQVAVNMQEWRHTARRWARVSSVLSLEECSRAFAVACESMGRLNRSAARLMHVHGAHGATDVTGFGLLGHAQNLASHQREAVDLIVDRLPLIRGMREADEACGGMFQLMKGKSAETSGGLLVALPADKADRFVQDLWEADGQPAWIVGRVVEGTRRATVREDAEVIPV